MKINIFCVIKRELIILTVGLLGLLYAPDMDAMQIGAGLYGKQNPTKTAATSEYAIFQKQLSTLSPTECLLCQEGTFKCIKADKNIFPTIEMLNQRRDPSKAPIISLEYPIQAIRNAVNLASTYSLFKDPQAQKSEVAKLIQHYSVAELANAANFFDYANSEELSKICLSAIKKKLLQNDVDNIHGIQSLSDEQQTSLLSAPINHCLRSKIIDTYQSNRKISLKDKFPSIKEEDIWSTIWSLDGNTLFIDTSDNLCIYETISHNPLQCINSPGNFDDHAFNAEGNEMAFTQGMGYLSVLNINQKEQKNLDRIRMIVPGFTFTKDNTGILFNSISTPSRLCLWNSSDPNGGYQTFTLPSDLSPKSLPSTSIAFTSDKKILATSCNNQLNLYNIENLNNIKVISSTPCPNSEQLIFTPDDKSIIACIGEYNVDNLIIFDVRDPSHIIPQFTINIKDIKNIGLPLALFNSVQCSSDGNYLITAAVTPDRKKSIAVLWDISDPDNISHYILGDGKALSIAPSRDNSCTIALVDTDSLKTWSLWTAKDNEKLNSLKSCDADQMRLVYNICFKSLRNLDNDQSKAFLTLPVPLQNLLIDLLEASDKTLTLSGTTQPEKQRLILPFTKPAPQSKLISRQPTSIKTIPGFEKPQKFNYLFSKEPSTKTTTTEPSAKSWIPTWLSKWFSRWTTQK